MSAEQRPGLGFSEIPWPTRVTEEDLARIASLRKHGRSLGASVAESILNESSQLFLSRVNSYLFSLRIWPWTPLEQAQKKLKQQGSEDKISAFVSVFWGYRFPACTLLNAEEYFSSGELDPVYSERYGESIVAQGGIAAIQENMGITDQGIDPEVVVLQAEATLEQASLAKSLQELTPTGLVNKCTELALIASTNPREKEGLEKGQRRFHQLYEDAQKAGL